MKSRKIKLNQMNFNKGAVSYVMYKGWVLPLVGKTTKEIKADLRYLFNV